MPSSLPIPSFVFQTTEISSVVSLVCEERGNLAERDKVFIHIDIHKNAEAESFCQTLMPSHAPNACSEINNFHTCVD